MSAALRDARRIVVRCPNWLGDVVMSTPALTALRAAAPHAEITALVPPALVPLLDGAESLDAVWPLASRGRGGLGAWRADRRRIAAGDFDLGLLFPESISSAWLLRAAGVAPVVGFARDPLRRALLHHEIAAPAAWGRRRLVSRERFGLTLLSGLGVEATDTSLALAVTEADAAGLRAVVHAQAGRGTQEKAAPSRPVVLAPGASFGPAKCWPPEAYAALGDRLVQRGFDVVLIGAPGEEERVEAVRARMKESALVLAGVLDLGALKALLRDARALVANDAGARHVAAAFGVPSVIFFGPTSVEKTADNLDRITVLEREHECRPCYRRTCPIDHRCLATIPVEEAFSATEAALGSVTP